MIEIAIIDDHRLFAEGVMKLLESEENLECTAAFQSLSELCNITSLPNYDVILLDINLQEENGLDVCKSIKRNHPNLKVIALTMIDNESVVRKMINNGADGYLLKNVDKSELIKAIIEVINGNIYIGNSVKSSFEKVSINNKDSLPRSQLIPSLSRREKDVLELIIGELTTQEIADKLKIGFSTVETHRRNIMQKLNVKSAVSLVKYAVKNNLISIEQNSK